MGESEENRGMERTKLVVLIAAILLIVFAILALTGVGNKILSSFGITGAAVYTDSCSISESGFYFEYLNYSIQDSNAILNFRITNNNPENLEYSAFEVKANALYPLDGESYTTNDNVYKVINPANNPFKSIKFEFEECSNEENFSDCNPNEVCPRLDKMVSLSILHHLSSNKSKTQETINKAFKEVQQSLLDKNPLWDDSKHIDCKSGNKVFNHEKNAVEELMKVITPNKNEYDAAVAPAAMNLIVTIVAADKKLATTLIDEANASMFLKNKQEFEAAIKELNKAGEEYNKGKYGSAIEHYKEAWHHAQKAVYGAFCNFDTPDSNITSCSGSGGACPRMDKIDSFAVLRGMNSNNSLAQRALMDAAKSLQKSLVGKDIKWYDDNHIACKKGDKVFANEQKAVEKLTKIINPAEQEYDSSISSQVLDLIVKLVAVDRQLAKTLINESNASTNKDIHEYATGVAELNAGDVSYSQSNYAKAIKHYKKSWQHVKKATYDSTSGDYCDFNWEEEEECTLKNGDSGIFTYTISLSDFNSLKNISVEAKADGIGGAVGTVIFKNPCEVQPPNCGNGVCEAGEDSINCPADCPPIPPNCGNGICESGENSSNCPVDCKNITVSIISPLGRTTFKVNDSIIFSMFASSTGSITGYNWYSSWDGLFGSSMTLNYSGLSIGVHNITAEITDSNGLIISDSIEITIQSFSAPVASIVRPSNGNVFKNGTNIIFSGSASDSDGNITSYLWTSDKDGILGNSSDIETSSLSVGKHKITFSVTDNDGLTSSYSINIEITALNAPSVSIWSPVDGADYRKGQEVTFVGVGSDLDGNITSYLWTSDKDGVIGTTSSFTFSGLSLGLHTITLTLTDNDGLTSSDSVQISVKPGQAPTASIIEPNDGDVFKSGDIIYFVGDGSDPDGNIVSWTWSSNIDGIIGNTQIFSRDNLSIGRHDITLTVIDDDALQFVDTFTVWILVNNISAPDVTITSPSDNSLFKEGTNIFFNATVLGNITSYMWTSNIDGLLSTSPSFTGNLSAGRHTIMLAARDENNLTSLDTITIPVVPITAPNVTITSPIGTVFNEGDSITFSADITDDGTIVSIVWNSNLDGNIGNTPSFSISTLTTGEHLITLIVTDNEGLVTSVQKIIRIISGVSPPVTPSGGGGGGGGGAVSLPCIPSWICTDWSPAECTPAGTQIRTCTDSNSCGSVAEKPVTAKTCEYVALSPPEEPLLSPEAAVTACSLFGLDFGFWWIMCWYWWILVLLLLLLLLLVLWRVLAVPLGLAYPRARICPRCHVKMKYRGRIRAGIQGGLRSVYVCPNCNYKTMMGEHLTDGKTDHDSHVHPCPRCKERMEKGGEIKEGPKGGLRRIYICPRCNYRTMLDEGLSAKEITEIAEKKK
jgi:tetratricopeptide (TPR) repeat protein